MWSMPSDNDNDSNDGGLVVVVVIMMMVMMKMILLMTIAEVGRWRENAEYALMIQTHSHPFPLLHRLKSQC